MVDRFFGAAFAFCGSVGVFVAVLPWIGQVTGSAGGVAVCRVISVPGGLFFLATALYGLRLVVRGDDW